jgi:hypothetical protein
MTNAITVPDPPPIGSRTAGFLTSVIISSLAPAFLGATGGDIKLARMAVEEIIGEYRARNRIDLIAVGQIVANGLAALGSLGQSMNDEIALPMALRLRGNAISLNRTAEQNRRARRENRNTEPVPLGVDTYVEPAPLGADTYVERPEETAPHQTEPFLQDDVAEFLAAESAARLASPAEQPADPAPAETAAATPPAPEEAQSRRTRAMAMIKEAAHISANLRTLPPADREPAEFRIAMLGRSARELLTGERLPPLDRFGDGAAMVRSG